MVEQSGSYGQYELLRPFGRGQVTEVFLAREKGAVGPKSLLVVHRVVASLASNGEFVDAFLNEAGVAGTLKHPNFVELYDLGELEGQHFVAEEYVAGGSLHELLDRRGDEPIPLGVALFIVAEVCAGLQFAHALAGSDGVPRNLVHKAINPRHVLVSIDGVVKITDFGMSTALAVLGVLPPGDPQETAAFLAPEQAQGADVDRRADIYSCGALLYHLTTGKLPIRAEDGTLPRPKEVVQDLPTAVDEMIVKAMATNPRERHPTCGALRRDIANTVESQKLQSDLSALAGVVRAEFPEVSGRDDDEDEGRATNPSKLVATPTTSTKPQMFPAPIAPPTEPSTAETSSVSPGDSAVPFLDEEDLIEDATERLPGLMSMEEVDRVLEEQPQPEPVEKKRSIWLWVVIAAVVGGLGVLAAVVVAVIVFFQPWGQTYPDFLSSRQLSPPAATSPQVTPEVPAAVPPAIAPPTIPQSVDVGSPALPATVTADGGPKPPDQEGQQVEPTKNEPVTPTSRDEREEDGHSHDKSESHHSRGDAGTSRDEANDRNKSTPSSSGRDGGARSSEGRDSSSRSSEEPPRRSTKRSSGTGSLFVLSRPTSRVYMDSRLLGTTPIMNRSVPAGRHTLVLVSPGFPSKRMPVTITPGQATQVRHLFTPGN